MKKMTAPLLAMLAAAMFGITSSTPSKPEQYEGRTSAEHQRRKTSAQAKRDRRRQRALSA